MKRSISTSQTSYILDVSNSLTYEMYRQPRRIVRNQQATPLKRLPKKLQIALQRLLITLAKTSRS